jgi:CubicO group peptidase (beta-lactamase class C family)
MPIVRDLTLANWLDAPYNRRGFQRVRELVPTARIARDDRDPTPLPAAPHDLDGLAFADVDGEAVTVAEHLDRSYADGFLVFRRGVVVYERYRNGMTPATRHLLMSVSKSYCGALAGVLVGRGLLAPDDLVCDLVPELRGTSFEGATVRHVLDMRTGTDCPEDYDAYDDQDADHPLLVYERAAGYRPRRVGEPAGILEHLRGLSNASRHGSDFEYRSVLTNVLARILEIVADTPYPELLGREIWAPLGPEHDAEIMLDPCGFPAVEGGQCTTLRDLARLGLAYLNDGLVGEVEVVPGSWVADTRDGDDGVFASFARTDNGWAPGGAYRNQWWVLERGRRFAALGIHGQMVYVDRDRGLVVARLATEPEAVHPTRLVSVGRAIAAIDGALE